MKGAKQSSNKPKAGMTLQKQEQVQAIYYIFTSIFIVFKPQ